MSLADEELRGCERDITVRFLGSEYPAWVIMERLLYIVDKNGDNVPFRLNRQQCRLYRSVCEQKRACSTVSATMPTLTFAPNIARVKNRPAMKVENPICRAFRTSCLIGSPALFCSQTLL